MAHTKSFEKELDKLFKDRTRWLHSVIGSKKPGKPPEFKRRNVDRGIDKLQEITSNALSNKLAKLEFERYAAPRRSWYIKGHGVKEKKSIFEKWFKKEFSEGKSCIYIFWGNNNKCIYVGRTGSSGGSRPSSHFEKHWFGEVKRIVVYSVNAKSQTPKLECLAIHHFDPKRNKNKSATKKWTKACPLCVVHENIEEELRGIFRFR
jgi:hypothetical protein